MDPRLGILGFNLAKIRNILRRSTQIGTVRGNILLETGSRAHLMVFTGANPRRYHRIDFLRLHAPRISAMKNRPKGASSKKVLDDGDRAPYMYSIFNKQNRTDFV